MTYRSFTEINGQRRSSNPFIHHTVWPTAVYSIAKDGEGVQGESGEGTATAYAELAKIVICI